MSRLNEQLKILVWYFIVAIGVLCLPIASLAASAQQNYPALRPLKTGTSTWGVTFTNDALASASRQFPVEVEFWSKTGNLTNVLAAYSKIISKSQGFVGKAVIHGPEKSLIRVTDSWSQHGAFIELARAVEVVRGGDGGFMTGFQFDLRGARAWTNAQWFAPGMIYGGFDHLTPAAIGGSAHYLPGDFTVRIREDRLPAPLIMASFEDHSSLTLLNTTPDGRTTPEEAAETKAYPMISEQFQFGALGGQEKAGKVSLGYWFPGSEGEVTYAGNTYPRGQMHQWRRRYHPLRPGFRQNYTVTFRFGSDEPFPRAMAAAHRWAWDCLKPQVKKHDIPAARRALVDVLATNAFEKNGRTGIPFSINARTADLKTADRRALMGFCGKNLEAVNFLLREAALANDSRAEVLRKTAEAIATSFLRFKMAPPEGEGWQIDTGATICAHGQVMFLRCFGDDVKALLRAYVLEKGLGRERPEWLAWCREFADWLLPQQRSDGGFPRSWKMGSSEVASASPNSSFNAVPLLVLLNQVTGESRYLQSAVRAADFCWNNGQSQARFVGGTIDNPDVLDKEAATLSIEAYLALFEATQDRKWLDRAKAAADYAATWIYLWNVPMAYDQTVLNTHWKPQASTVGVQLIATGHSLVDEYMCFDADDFARLYKYSGDAHYYAVARLLLHNTKSMLALPGRTYDLAGPGWQQEHWSMAPPRGTGLHRRWLPWVATSHLNGIFGLLDFDPQLFEKLSRAEELN